ncbi:hypothetical protein L1987_18598 [Smallanthus sonchifolius]|uniref:Uncharacterized protein n=1 Tax=Smallanthus sonchifolius TaxID=185202 RepID=A0ACB9J072_9ASTR|nr:hypothetical protein L1987_18598 [Smallanthus sonchifolius]
MEAKDQALILQVFCALLGLTETVVVVQREIEHCVYCRHDSFCKGYAERISSYVFTFNVLDERVLLLIKSKITVINWAYRHG